MALYAVLGMAVMLNLADGNWRVISDGVMGGKSRGETVANEDCLIFQGELSLENGGGFSSARRLIAEPPAGSQGVRLLVKGDGRRYQLRLRHDRAIDGISWRAVFDTTGAWQQVELPFSEFESVFRGTPVSGAGPVRPASISQLGLLVADRKPGPFRLSVRLLEFFP